MYKRYLQVITVENDFTGEKTFFINPAEMGDNAIYSWLHDFGLALRDYENACENESDPEPFHYVRDFAESHDLKIRDEYDDIENDIFGNYSDTVVDFVAKYTVNL